MYDVSCREASRASITESADAMVEAVQEVAMSFALVGLGGTQIAPPSPTWLLGRNGALGLDGLSSHDGCASPCRRVRGFWGGRSGHGRWSRRSSSATRRRYRRGLRRPPRGDSTIRVEAFSYRRITISSRSSAAVWGSRRIQVIDEEQRDGGDLRDVVACGCGELRIGELLEEDVGFPYRTRWPCWMTAKPIAWAKWLFPVPGGP